MSSRAEGVPTSDVRLQQLSSGVEPLLQFLEQIAVIATDAVEGEVACEIMLFRADVPSTIALSDGRLKVLDELQYATSDGPALDAARAGEAVVIPDLTAETRWEGFRASALEQGLHSLVSLPLALGDLASGAMTAYATQVDAFDSVAEAALRQFRDAASRAISLALREDHLTQENDHLHAAIASRRLIDQAVGIIMGQNRCTAAEAFAILRRASQHRNVKLRNLAAEIITNVTGSEPDDDPHWRPHA
jgi:GAF domain-containing protein